MEDRKKAPDLSIIIPCYNEEENIKPMRIRLLETVKDLGFVCELVFIDDGSTDATWDELQDVFQEDQSSKVKIVIRRHTENRGLGAAIKTGFEVSSGSVLVTADSDGTYSFTEIPALLERLGSQTMMVTASPYHPEGKVEGVPGYRLLLSRGSSFIYRLLVDWKIHTYTSLFRAYRRELIDTIEVTSDDYLAGTEILVKAILHGGKVAEYPTILRVRQFGTSKARILQTIQSHLKFQLKVLAHRLKLVHLVEPMAHEGVI